MTVVKLPDRHLMSRCRVCGFDMHPDLPWGEDGMSPDHNICSCCGVEFGYEDDGIENCRSIRMHWVEIEHCAFRHSKEKPEYWSPSRQLRMVPEEFRGPEDERLIELASELELLPPVKKSRLP